MMKPISPPYCIKPLSSVDGYVEWYLKGQMIGNNSLTKTQHQSTNYYNITCQYCIWNPFWVFV